MLAGGEARRCRDDPSICNSYKSGLGSSSKTYENWRMIYVRASVGRNRPRHLKGEARGISRERTMVFEYWLVAIAVGEILLMRALLRPEAA